MMKKSTAKRGSQTTVDLTKIEGDGSFPCPECGAVISPEDESEEFYKILDTKVVDDQLTELIVECGNCGSIIKLTGFQQMIEA
jgi:predicted RNA-binding Zn-ribbon protein involved in translation (DUF1610 family)